MSGLISAEDRALIERTRSVNKTLSVFVFALQEGSNLPAESQVGIANMLVALADTVRKRATPRITLPPLKGVKVGTETRVPGDRRDRSHRPHQPTIDRGGPSVGL